jgi:hypothetical protein
MIKQWIFPIAIGLILALFVLVLRGQYDWYGVSDAFLFPGMFMVGIILLRMMSRTGVYDVAGYGVSSFRDAFRRDGKKVYDSMVDYQQSHMSRRKNKPLNYLPTLVVGLTFIGLAFLFAQLALS